MLLPWESICPEPLPLPLERGTNTPGPIKAVRTPHKEQRLAAQLTASREWLQLPRPACCLPAIPPPSLTSSRSVPLPPRCSPSTPCPAAAGSPGSVGTPGAKLGCGSPCGDGCHAAVCQLGVGQQSSSCAQGGWWCLAHLPLHRLLPAPGGMGQPQLCGAHPPLMGCGGAAGFGSWRAAGSRTWQGLLRCWRALRLRRVGLCVLGSCRCPCSAAPQVSLVSSREHW